MERYYLSAAQDAGNWELPAGACKASGISLAIGFFDGVHLGHREVIRQAVLLAKQQGRVPAVMTFDPHPRVVLGQGAEYETVLTPLEDKLLFFAELGVEAAYIVHFDLVFSRVTAERFVQELIMPLGVKTAVVGFDFKFGYRGQGNAETLGALSGGQIRVEVVSPVYRDGSKVSSTRVRDRLAGGECGEAAALLGRPYEIKGRVVHGQARGRLLGFPTANVQPEQPYVVPRPGVYAIEARTLSAAGRTQVVYNGVLNVGYRPTFEALGGELKLEAHLFDFDGDLYGSELGLVFHAFLRPETKFESVDALVAQIRTDAAQARNLLAKQNC